MKTYPYTTDEGIIELVSKDEYDTIVVELLSRLEERTQSHIHASARDVQTIQRQSVLLGRLASALKAIAWIKETGQRDYSWTGETAFESLAAYESAKSGNLPDPLVEAVKRMEAVTDGAIEAAYWDTGSWTRNVRACLIQAAKGESV